jgi:hypothetical protein
LGAMMRVSFFEANGNLPSGLKRKERSFLLSN